VADGLAVFFVADNDTNDVLTVSSLNGRTWLADTYVGQTSPVGPAVTEFNGRLWLACVENDDTRNLLVSSSADGVFWGLNNRIGQVSQSAPSLAVYNGQLWMAFIAQGSSRNVMVCSSADGTHWSGSKAIGQAAQSAPSLAVFNGQLWMAFIANDDTHKVLVCATPDGIQWSGNTAIGEASELEPSLAVFGGRLWAAFVAGNGSNNVLVCSSPDGTHWSGNTAIGQAALSAPSLAVFNGELWIAFTANNDTRNVLVCSSPDGTHWSGNTAIGQATQSAPFLAAFSGFVQSSCVAPGPFLGPNPVPAPSEGLGSSSNYILASNCNPLHDLMITICVTQDMISDIGFSFQLNCYSPQGKTSAFQQYSIVLYHSSELRSITESWTAANTKLVDQQSSLCSLATANTLPAGYQVQIVLQNDASGNVTGASYVVIDRAGVLRAQVNSPSSTWGVSQADLAPIVAFELNLVGPGNKETAKFSSGAGTITYSTSASTPLTVLSARPACTETNLITDEKANTSYGLLSAGPSIFVPQSFTVNA
jgi:putative hemolysin